MTRSLLPSLVAGLLTLLAPVARAEVSLVAVAATPPALVGDCETLAVDGIVEVRVRCAGTDPVTDRFDVLVFEDRDGDSAFTPGVDAQLGVTTVGSPLAPGAAVTVAVPVAGTVEFRDAPLHAWVDPEGAVLEVDDTDDVVSTAARCALPPVTSSFDLVVEWEWTGMPVLSTPLVADVDADGAADVLVATTFQVIVCLDGRTGAEKWRTTDRTVLPAGYSTPAVGELDGDPQLEVVSLADADNLALWDDDGSLVWLSPVLTARHPLATGGVTLADLDCDGLPEAIFGPDAANTEDGSFHWTPDPGGTWGSSFNYSGISSAADVDGDGELEVVAGPTAYELDPATGAGRILWTQPAVADGFTAVAQLDGDALPEIVVVPPERVVALEGESGAVIWDVPLPWGRGRCTPQWSRGGPPTVGDLDGDGEAEIGVANSDFYSVFEADGSLKWSAPTADCSSAGTAGTFFDLDADGSVEVIYQDEEALRILRGVDGFELASLPSTTGTVQEMPTIADVDGDGHAEILVAMNPWEGRTEQGVRCVGDRSDAWSGARSLWHEHAYHPDAVGDRGTIPPTGTGACEGAGWLDHGSYRMQVGSGDGLGTPLADVTLTILESHVETGPTCNPVLTVQGRVGNGGARSTDGPIGLRFYDGDPTAGGSLVDSDLLPELTPGQWVPFSRSFPVSGARDVHVVADDDGTGGAGGAILECREDNNACAVPAGPESVPRPAAVGPFLFGVAHGDPHAADISGTFDWSGDQGLPRPPGDHYHLLRATRPDALAPLVGAEPWTATSWEDVTPASPSRPTCHFLRVVAADDCERTETAP